MYFKKIFFAVAILGLVFMAVFSYFVYTIMLVPNTSFRSSAAYVTIPSDAVYMDLRSDLIPLLKDIKSFDALAKQRKYIGNIKAGRYKILKDMNNNAIIDALRSQNTPIRLSFNNTPNFSALAQRVATQIEADSSSLIGVFTDTIFLKNHGFTSQTALAMYLPNTYEFYWNTSAKQFRTRMLREYQRFWNKTRLAKADKIGLSQVDVMILASIVHEESKAVVEQKRIAGVYMNRLNSNWPLQADPTLKFAAYQLPKYQNTILRRILSKHKKIVSPYNTYMYRGLPPGLIAMPDISAIEAVLNYEQHSFYYFAVDPSQPGLHKFAKDLSTHNANARSYHRYLNKKRVFN